MASMGDLKHNLDQYGAFNEDCVRFIMKSAIQALIELKKYGIVQLNVKPEIILVAQNAAVKLADFDFALRLPKDGKLEGFCGTCGFVAPEVLQYYPRHILSEDIFKSLADGYRE
jgi:serine/threonine protein kinase